MPKPSVLAFVRSSAWILTALVLGLGSTAQAPPRAPAAGAAEKPAENAAQNAAQNAAEKAAEYAVSDGAQKVALKAPERVLFVGNSYLYYNDSVHNHAVRIARARRGDGAGPRYVYKSATIGGARLGQHDLDHLLAHENLGVEAPFQVVVLQGASFETLTDRSRARFLRSVQQQCKKVRAAGARPMLYMTPAYAKGHARYAVGQTKTIAAAYVAAGKAVAATVIPVGLAFAAAQAQRPELGLHKPFDHSHPSLAGTYLAACVVYATLYRRRTAGVGYDYFGAVPAADARFLQRIADATVAEFRGQPLAR